MADLNDRLDEYFGKFGMDSRDLDSDNNDVVRKYFSKVVMLALTKYDVSVEDLADELPIPVARLTVLRWESGVANPHMVVKKDVLEWIVDNIPRYK